MGGSAAVLRVADLGDGLYDAWDELCESRGVHADIYSTAAWFRSWAAVASPAELRRTRLMAVLDGERPLALLPLRQDGFGGWSSVSAFGYRHGLVAAGERPEPEVIARLAEQLGRSGVHALTLRRLPLRDPATSALVTALGQAGFGAVLRPAETDHVTPVHGGWEEHARRFRGFSRYAQRMVGRMTPLWDVSMDTYGTSSVMTAAEGFAIYDQIQQNSWKGAFTPAVHDHRASLLRFAERNGWTRLFVLRIEGVPAAAHIWFRIGDVAVWLSTAYDQRLASLSPGTVAQWWAHERMFADPAPRLVDLLPGVNAQKDRLTTERPLLVDVAAVRRRSLTVAPAAGRARALASAASRRAQGALPHRRTREPGPAPTAVRVLRLVPDAAKTTAVEVVATDAAMLRYLAVAGSHPSGDAMTERWEAGDEWVRLGDRPSALLRLGPRPDRGGRLVKEVIHVAPDVPLSELAESAASGLGEPLTLVVPDPAGTDEGEPVEQHLSPLPWPGCFDSTLGVTAHARR